jgi:hypothetical protein
MSARLGLACAIGAVCALVFAGPASAARGMEIAMQDDPVFLHRHFYDRDLALQQARALGVTRLRVLLVWSQVVSPERTRKRKPRQVTYDFSRFDDLIDAAAAYGIRLQITITGPAPAWATLDRKVGVFIPDPEQFGELAREAARHFRGRVDRYSLWNEPNHTGWLQPKRYSALRYRELYLAGYRAIKQEDPAAQIHIGELAPFPRTRKVATAPGRFLRELTCLELDYRRRRQLGSCPRLPADGFAHHPYQYERSPTYRFPGRDNFVIGTLGRLTKLLDRLARARLLSTPAGRPLDLYLTEFGYFASGRLRIPESRRSTYLQRAYTMALRNPRVRQMLQYVLVDAPDDYPGSFFNLSLVRLDGSLSPPFHALQGWVRRYGARGEVTLPGAPLELPPAPR